MQSLLLQDGIEEMGYVWNVSSEVRREDVLGYKEDELCFRVLDGSVRW